MGITRRNALKMIAATSVVSQVSGWGFSPSSKPTTSSFYIWLHGVFGITIEPERLVLVSPNFQDATDNKHVYAVGKVREVKKHPCKPTLDVFEGIKQIKFENGSRYTTRGLTGAQAGTDLDKREFAIFKPEDAELDEAAKALFFELPLPARIRPLRFRRTQVDEFESKIGALPLLHVLEYEKFDSSGVAVLSSKPNGRVLYATSRGQRHLHIFAEPDPACRYDKDCSTTAENCHSPEKTIDGLISCYKRLRSFKFQTPEEGLPPLTDVLGLSHDLREQFSLAEWLGYFRADFQSASPKENQPTHQPSDCPLIIVLAKNVPILPGLSITTFRDSGAK